MGSRSASAAGARVASISLGPPVVAVALLALALVAVGLGGCAPIGATTPPAGSAQVTTADRTHEYPSPSPPAEHAPGAATPQAAILSFTTAYINWNAASVTGDLSALAIDSVGQARATMQLAASETAGDDELHRSGIANRGTVETIGPLRGKRDEYVVVTRESTTASSSAAYQGLRPAWHITVATVRDQGAAGWVLSGWQPEG
jgi:hypothetical protein